MDFDRLEQVQRFYDGAAKKIAVKYNNRIYMVKYPVKEKASNDLNTEYSNGSFSEYISCHIINAMQIPDVQAQETILGMSKGKVAVACRDFTTQAKRLVKFNMIQNADIDSEASGRHPVLEDVLQSYRTMPILQDPKYITRFWDTFALDALLGNFDRHSGNWGFLDDTKNHTLELAPIFDCGSCLYPALSESHMERILDDEQEIQRRIFEFPASALISKETRKKISYARFLQEYDDKNMLASIKRVGERYHPDIIRTVLDETLFLSDIQKEFYQTMIQQRYEKLIEPVQLTRCVALDLRKGHTISKQREKSGHEIELEDEL